jgi:mRNA-degrading endonuclease toxin of MazEF toxin-antitoxin module
MRPVVGNCCRKHSADLIPWGRRRCRSTTAAVTVHQRGRRGDPRLEATQRRARHRSVRTCRMIRVIRPSARLDRHARVETSRLGTNKLQLSLHRLLSCTMSSAPAGSIDRVSGIIYPSPRVGCPVGLRPALVFVRLSAPGRRDAKPDVVRGSWRRAWVTAATGWEFTRFV